MSCSRPCRCRRRPSPASRCRSTSGSTISLHQRVLRPERANLTVELRVDAGGTRDPASISIAGRCRGRSPPRAGCAHRRAIAPRHPAAGDDRRRQPLFLSGYARCSRSFRGAERLAQRRPADRRNRGWPPGGLARFDRGRARDWTGRRPRPDRDSRRGPSRRRPGRRCRRGTRRWRPDNPARHARRAVRRPAAKHHALRVPDPQPEGAEPRPCRRDGGRRPTRGACLRRRRHPYLPRARRRAARPAPAVPSSAGRSSCRIPG